MWCVPGDIVYVAAMRDARFVEGKIVDSHIVSLRTSGGQGVQWEFDAFDRAKAMARELAERINAMRRETKNE